MKTVSDFWKFTKNIDGSASLDDAFIAWAKANKLTIKEGNALWRNIVTSVNSALSVKIADDVEMNFRGNPEDIKKVLAPGSVGLSETGLPPAENVTPEAGAEFAGDTAPVMEESLTPEGTPANVEPKSETEPLLSLKGTAPTGAPPIA